MVLKMKLKRKCVYCNELKEIHIDKRPPICDDCYKRIQSDKHYVIKLLMLIIIIILIFLLSLLIQ